MTDVNSVVDVSVIIPCYRCVETLERAVKSVFSQSQRPRELILVDDCSGDDTLVEIRRLKSVYPEGWIKDVPLKKNAGPGTARNAGWATATSHYIAFLDSDDAWHPCKIKIQLDWMQAHPDVYITGHGCSQITTDVNISDFKVDISRCRFSLVPAGKLLTSNAFSTRSVMMRRDTPKKFIDGMRYCEDYMLWVSVVFAGLPAFKCNQILAYSFKTAYGESGLSSHLWKMEKGELEVYKYLREGKLISTPRWGVLVLWSLLRYLKRLFV